MAKQASSRTDPKGRWPVADGPSIPPSGQAWLYPVRDATLALPGPHLRKVLMNRKRIARFKIEIAVMNALAAKGHAVVPIVDTFDGDSKHRPYYVMPLYAGGNLQSAIKAGRFRDTLGTAIPFLRELHGVLHGVHTSGASIAHRDLKPENVLLSDDGRPVLCDFGCCRLLHGDGTDTEYDEQVGSRHFIAPEALAGPAYVSNYIALDAYAYGKLVYAIVSGQRLPGVQLPVAKSDLAAVVGDRPEIRILNALVTSLVSHDIDTRMSAWFRVERALELAERPAVQRDLTSDADLEAELASLRGAPRVKEAESMRARDAARRSYVDRIVAVFADEVGKSRARRLADEPALRNFSFNLDSTGEKEWWRREGFALAFPLESDRVWIAGPWQVWMVGSGHSVRAVLDAQWGTNNDHLHLRLAVVWAAPTDR